MRNLTSEIRARREEGFTLIELLIVIVVLGILSGIVVLGVNQFRTDATTAACKASVDTIQVAVDAFVTQNPTTAPTTINIAPYLKAGTVIPTGLTIAAASPYAVTSTVCP